MDSNLNHVNFGLIWSAARLTFHLSKLRMICVQPGKYWHCFEGNLGETVERRGRARMGLSECHDAILIQNWNWNWSRLEISTTECYTYHSALSFFFSSRFTQCISNKQNVVRRLLPALWFLPLLRWLMVSINKETNSHLSSANGFSQCMN